jgi:hypothetical protein
MRNSYLEELAKLKALGLSEQQPAEADKSHEELAVLDRSGRLQLPREYLNQLGIRGRGMLKAEMDDGRIILTLPTDVPGDSGRNPQDRDEIRPGDNPAQPYMPPAGSQITTSPDAGASE